MIPTSNVNPDTETAVCAHCGEPVALHARTGEWWHVVDGHVLGYRYCGTWIDDDGNEVGGQPATPAEYVDPYATTERDECEAAELAELQRGGPVSATDTGPRHPAHLIWAAWTNNDTGQVVLTNREGEVFHFDPGEAPHIAVALAEHCDDNDERAFVRDSWGDVDDFDDEEDE